VLCAAALVAGCSSTSTTAPESASPAETRAEARAEPRGGDRADNRVAADVATDGDIATDPALLEVPAAALTAHERAVAAMAAGDRVEAELELEQLIVEYADFPGPFVNLAIVYRQDGRDEDARQMLERALEIDPQHAPANNQLGMLLREAGEFEAAEAAYLAAIAGDPSYDLAYYNLGVLLDLYLLRGVEALEAYEKFQSLQAEPDAEVGRWIIDLRRRLGTEAPPERLAQEAGQ
jgi:tetratricopeptide (TPR) repeat protein